MSQVRISLLGAPHIELDDRPFEVDTRKAVALLAYLAVTGEVRRRDELAALLWPDYDDINARAALRRTLSVLKKALDSTGLIVTRDTVGLDASQVWVDVTEFQRLIKSCRQHGHDTEELCDKCLANLDEAASLYRGDFLLGFSLRDSLEFEDWQSFQTESLRRELSAILERLIRGNEDFRHFESAITIARRWLAIDPLQESAHRALMRLYAATGDRTSALRQFRECLRVLDAELGVQPLEETVRLYEAIAADSLLGAAPLPVSATPEAPPKKLPTRLKLPMLGRRTELELMHEVCASVKPDGRLIVIEGEAGVGKSRLVEEFLAELRAGDSATLMARCYEGESGLVYAPFIELIRTGIRQAQDRLGGVSPMALQEAGRLEPELMERAPDPSIASSADTSISQSRLFAGVSEVLEALAGSTPPGAIVIEDLHWADEASIELLTYLARRLQGHPICLIVTWREEQIPYYHRLRRLLADSERDDLAGHIHLTRLSQATLASLVEALRQQGVPISTDVEERVVEETEGLPFFVAEYLQAIGQGLAEGESDWAALDGGRSLLLSRLSLVGEQGHQLLAAAAVLGRHFSFESIRGASGRSDEETIAALEELTALGILREGVGENTTEYDFTHEKLRSLVYTETSLARRRLLHRRAGDTTLRSARHRDRAAVAAKAAQHYQLAGEDTLAAEQYAIAGEYARGLHANSEALSHFQAALALRHPQPSHIHEAIAGLLVLAGQYSTAMTEYETAAALAAPDELASVEHSIASLYLRLGQWDAADHHYREAEREFGESGREGARARMYADWSLNAQRHGDSERATILAQTAFELAQAGKDDLATAQAENILGILANARHDHQAARSHLENSLALAEELKDTTATISALNNLALTYRATNELKVAADLTRRALALVGLEGDRHREAALHNNLADLLQKDLRTDEAMEHLKQAVTIFAEVGNENGEMLPEIWKLVEW